jgi:hypothetical protein
LILFAPITNPVCSNIELERSLLSVSDKGLTSGDPKHFLQASLNRLMKKTVSFSFIVHGYSGLIAHS